MTAMPATKKPRVIGIVILSVLAGLLTLAGGLIILSSIAVLQSDPTYADIIKAATPFAYIAIVLGVLDLVAAVLLLMYKRLGLLLAALTYGLSLLLNVYNQVSGSGGATNIGGILLDLVVLYYVYIYLTREPDKSFFT